MDARTLTALKGSIAKWQAIVDGTGEDHGADNCPLCIKFLYQEPSCDGCPVFARTGEDGCSDTPYKAWIKARNDGVRFPLRASPETLPLAQAELAFLQSLLPEDA